MGSYYNDNTIVFLDGGFVKAIEAKVDLYTQSLHYGYSVFEGIRSYKTANGETKIFKATEHYERLKISAEALNIPFNYTVQQLIDATYEVLRQNDLQDAYIRPLVYGPANMSFNKNIESHLVIAVWEMPLFFGEKLLRVVTSSFERPNPKGFKIYAKAAGHYVNSILASQEAKSKGYDEALLLDMNGNVAEGTGANVFYEKDKVLYTPAKGNILPGITRATVIEICDELKIPVVEKFFTPEEMHRADGSFYCGTAAEIVGLESLDDVPFKLRWEDTFGYVIQQAYKNLVREQKDADINLVASTDLIDPITIGAEVSDASALLSVNSTEVE
ncbi:MAG TPA: branched-chain amino acid transaminase [Chitinophagaceae bacterium]|jgi:branched-chain amino acid aminotransferase|nr:branched-chain amino acid transaminase [Chitinophagaceae bacterium]